MRAHSGMGIDMANGTARRTVAVIGGGYGGSAVAKALDEETDVVLIDPRDAFVHAAGALRALVRPDWAENIFFPYDTLLKHGTVRRGRAAAVDPDGVTLASGERIAADYLVLATGSDYPFPAKTDTDLAGDALARIRDAHAELAAAGRVLIAGAGPVGLELSGEIKAVWPEKHVVVTDPAEELMPGFLPELREELLRQLDALGVELRLGTALAEEPPSAPGRLKPFTVTTTTGGDAIGADLWFRCYGVRSNGDYLADGRITARDAQGRVPVTERLNVVGHDHIYALGDLTDLAEAKMAGYAMKHAEVVAANVLAQVRGESPTGTYRPSPPSVLLPLGPGGGVGQVPTPDGPAVLPAEQVSAYKGRDLFTGRFAELFGITRD